MKLGWLICAVAFCLSFAESKPKGLELFQNKQTFFVGREPELQLISKHIKEGHAVILTGPQGIGKSSLAIEYALKRARHYDLMWSCDGKINFPKNIHNLALICGIPTKHIGLSEIVQALRAHAKKSTHQRFLFIFNNINVFNSLLFFDIF